MSGPLHLLAQGQLAIWTGAMLAALSTAVQVWHHAVRASGPARAARWVALASGLAAAALRSWVGSGPGDWAEAGRWSWLFAVAPPVDARTAAVPVVLEPLLAAGVPAAWIYDGFGPVVSGLCATATVALAVRSGAAVGAAGAAGLALALWPAHVVFGAGGALTVWGGLGWVMLLLTASDERLGRTWRGWGCAGWAVVLMSSRPEYALAPLVALLGAWLLRWPRTALVQLALALAVLVPCASLLAPQEVHGDAMPTLAGRAPGWTPLYWQFAAVGAAPVWVCAAGLAGLWWVRPRGLGLVMALLWGALTTAYALHTDGNLMFGSWRYLLSLLPILLVGAAVGLGQLRPKPRQLVSALLVLSCLPYAPLWLLPTDMRAEFARLRALAPTILEQAQVLVLDDDDGDAELGYEQRDRAVLAIALATNLRWAGANPQRANVDAGTTPLGRLGDVPVYGLGQWLRMAEQPVGATVVWMGVATERAEREAIARRVGGEVLLPSAERVWPTIERSGWCNTRHRRFGLFTPTCQLELGWRVVSWPASSRTANR